MQVFLNSRSEIGTLLYKSKIGKEYETKVNNVAARKPGGKDNTRLS